MTDLSELRFFQTSSHTCGYLEDQQASNIFVDPELSLDAGLYSVLSDYGFRRSGRHVYRPRCQSCNACIPIRVLAEEFIMSRSQRRCLKKNSDLIVTKVSNIDDDEYYELYERYINERHRDGEMFPPTREQYQGFLTSEWGMTTFFEARDAAGSLISVAVSDKLTNGYSAMYTFFAPEETQRSLGVFNILIQVLECQKINAPYLYLGYWIKHCDKMAYKTNYRPFELFVGNQWKSFG